MSKSTDRNNPNNCGTCQHMLVHKGPGWCYMFRSEPTEQCMQHTSLFSYQVTEVDCAIDWSERNGH